jgi:hypothetical protein
MMPVDAYRQYLALKNHFTKESYDYHKYCGKSRATVQSFYKRKDRFWFEKVTRQKTDKEIIDFFVANFVSCSDPERLWIGEIIKEGESNYKQWQKRIQSLSYTFKEELESVVSGKDFDSFFKIQGSQHPQLLKEHLQGNISIETLLILEKILGYRSHFDSKLNDPVWHLTSMRIKKYSSFLNIDVFRYKKMLKEIVVGEK